ncbi:acyl-CoA dehydrogenase family protein [Flexivirga caeni]|uniref:Acyl-CoA dehydrogenase n=1 Tax=Flexivirga caeni TaxID=2294115 RepID=A0A3M9LZR2_9MICO|nr:acyl-CoA dehydrogenase family protein [Flexivirga caeni]RNI18415.1 acyl-CoA dehydrogenase [Flexivirga caeni]
MKTSHDIVPLTREEMVARVRELGPTFAERAVRYDREAVFPWENFADLKASGLLALCVPEEYGGIGASYADYARVSAEIGRYCGATALTFNMHNATMLWAGQVADMLDFSAEDRALHHARRAELFRGVVEEGAIHSQPFSEGISAGATSGVHTKAEPVAGGFRVTGRKIFASLSGAASRYNVTCQVPCEPFIRLLSIPAAADGIQIVGDWDPLGMRGTVSRTLLFENVFVPADNEVLPARGYDQAAQRFPFLFMSLAPSYLGLTRGVLDFTRTYLRGETPGQTPGGARRDLVQKQVGWGQMQIDYETSRAILYDVLDNTRIDPDEELLARAWVAVYTVMENANKVASLAVRVCGGQSMLKHLPLERMYRDSRLGITMLPWSGEVCLDRLGKVGLYD